jgi:glycerol-3-phosphate acyltransferase PlsY
VSNLLVEYPFFALFPAVVFAGASLWWHSRTAWIAALLWAAYVAYEIVLGFYCTHLCQDRLDLLVVYPLLGLVTMMAAVQLYVRHRDRLLRRQRRRERRRTMARDMGS